MSRASQNLLLSRLPPDEYQRLSQRMLPVTLELKQVLYKFHDPIDFVYFPTNGAASALMIMEDGSAIEVATVGKEGVVGQGIVDATDDESPHQVIVQVAGAALRMDADDFKQEAREQGPLRQLLIKYNKALLMQISQSVACNGLHPVEQRCCRWLLITLDRMESNLVPLTHEFLAIMLGVRRSSVTDILGALQQKGLIENGRGMITVRNRVGLEKRSCECYKKVKDEFRRLLG
jgi:CRP-like cAMP-binding protein